MSNVTIGNSKEQEVCKIFKAHHYWAHVCAKNANGSQPVDIIAIKGGTRVIAWLVDSKNVEKGKPSFSIDRIEDNQWASLEYANNFAQIDKKNLGFVIYFERTEDFYWLPYEHAVYMKEHNIGSINLCYLKKFEEVLNEYDN